MIDFLDGARRALADPELQTALGGAVRTVRERRDALVATLPEWPAWRARAAAVREAALADLEGHLDRLERAVRHAGGEVHHAPDATAARALIVDLVRRYGARRIVKSKSSTTEEIDLNPALEAAGAEVTETDLGEFIVQLAGERPVHFVAPAFHKSAGQVARLFAERLGTPPAAAPEDLTRRARAHLRAVFLGADLGITGVNFAAADTGTLVLVENEGNARLTTTLPRVHVAVMGIEKVIPRLTDLALLLRVLAPSAVGTRAAEYVSLLTGPRRPDEHDGPEALHLVLLDNGRRRILADPEVREALRCIRCGACLNACPVYERAGGHAYGSIYSGPIGAVVTPLLQGIDRAGQLPFASTLCGRCAEVCPVGIDLPRLLLVLRRRAVEAGQVAWLERVAVRLYAAAAADPNRWGLAGRALRAALRPLVRDGAVRWLPPPLGGWTASRDFPAPPPAAWRDHPAGSTVARATAPGAGRPSQPPIEAAPDAPGAAPRPGPHEPPGGPPGPGAAMGPGAATHANHPASHESVPEDPVEALAARWRRTAAHFHRVRPEQVGDLVAALLQEVRARAPEGAFTVALTARPLVERLGLRAAVSQVADRVLDPATATRDALAGAQAGLTVADYAVAETGTLVERASADQPRAFSLLPPVHLALVPAGAVLPTLPALFAVLEREEPPSAWTCISGPSGTADIGLTYVSGVHGPGEVHVMLIEELS
ncbi:MAG: LutB/LldF family L-lactate oxidation iron-sulfur protein [Armatimonadota bacterium]|nr:LutB/LldF family L-lactate oxidation iron-sulfur protein [Armatimonadota bacterium]MDR7448622.1 LutB/LldF family L-lactate oxidation iron-sulfur protein [Armatimonadota bacterium]MDR7459394.1 LutB/LldF family L-lactate oxidation iron-sulfur protein [Armatimonadota bacterium]MDR7478557.1 LutB/LldF family L-lactate oxidation iron-sulfur protein [Armatimonadota bacterium]MDR7491900.1 LutB/LldF family L-lactate oxidation iron-sulfur protein [Armatimonadota bacterium]